MDALPISENQARLPPMEKMERVPGRNAKADQVNKTQYSNLKFHACSNLKQYKWFSLPTVACQMQWGHLTALSDTPATQSEGG